MIGDFLRTGNGSKRCRSHSIPLIDTPHAFLHVKMTLSSKTPKSDFEDMVSLDSVIQVRIEWNFQSKLRIYLLAFWHQFQGCQEPSCPPRLQGWTSRTHWVLMDSFKSKVDETYSIGSEYISRHVDTNSMGIRNHPVLQDSKVELGGHSESWWTFSSQELMKLTVLAQNTYLSMLTPIPMVSETIMRERERERERAER